MAKSVKSKNSAKRISKDAVLQAYKVTLLMQGTRPPSVFKFCSDNGIVEADFYSFFGSFEALEKALWASYAEIILNKLLTDPSYATFSAREKILSFYFTMAETLRSERSFVLMQLQEWKNPAVMPGFIKGFKRSVDNWIDVVMASARQSGEIAKRPFLDTRYASMFWLHTMFILQFWSHDESAGFENTDVAIEKSVNLAFDLIGKGVLDNALDFGKFLYQNSKN